MGNQGNQLFSKWDISFYGESGEIWAESYKSWKNLATWADKQVDLNYYSDKGK